MSISATAQRVLIAPPQPLRHLRRLLSRQGVRRSLGGLWLLDGLLQLQPSMFTSNLITGIMQPSTQGQPGMIADTIQPIINLAAQHVVAVNAMIALVQIGLGICLLGGWLVRPALLASIVWAGGVWYGGEGLGMLLTGQASVLTGAPGAVVLYALLAAVAYPGHTGVDSSLFLARVGKLLTRSHLQQCLAGFWGLAALPQLQPYWWQPHQISGAAAAMEGQGTLNGTLFGSSIAWVAQATAAHEVVLNLGVILVSLGLAAGLASARTRNLRPFLLGSIVASALIWWATEAFGQLFTGTATDVNSGPLLILMALACWPVMRAAPNKSPRNLPQSPAVSFPSSIAA